MEPHPDGGFSFEGQESDHTDGPIVPEDERRDTRFAELENFLTSQIKTYRQKNGTVRLEFPLDLDWIHLREALIEQGFSPSDVTPKKKWGVRLHTMTVTL